MRLSYYPDLVPFFHKLLLCSFKCLLYYLSYISLLLLPEIATFFYFNFFYKTFFLKLVFIINSMTKTNKYKENEFKTLNFLITQKTAKDFLIIPTNF